MRRLAPTVLALLVALPGSLAAQQLDKEQRKYLLDYLEKTRDKLVAATSGLSAEQWQFKPAPEVWSVAEVLEHITVGEVFVKEYLENQIAQTPLTDEQRAEVAPKTEKIVPMMLDRSQKFQAPEVAQPAARFGNGKEVLEAFRTTRKGMIAYTKTTDADLQGHGAEHPAFGMLNGYQWLVFIVSHGERHLMQIEEVKAHPEFPKKST